MYTPVVCVQFSILKNVEILGLILIGRNLKWSVLIGSELIVARGRQVKIPYESIVSTDLIGREPSSDM